MVLVSGLGVNGSNGHIGADAFEPNDLSWAVGRRIPPTGAAVDLHALLVLGHQDVFLEAREPAVGVKFVGTIIPLGGMGQHLDDEFGALAVIIRLAPVDNSLIFINFMNRLRAKRTDSLTNRFFLLSIRPV